MIIVESTNEYSNFKKNITNQPSLVIPIYSDQYLHSSKNRISFLYVCLFDKTEYIISFHHNDIIACDKSLNEILNPNSGLFVYEKKKFLYHFHNSKMNDIDLMQYFSSNQIIDLESTTSHDFLSRRLYKFKNLNDVIPITKHYERCCKLRDKFFSIKWTPPKSYDYYNDLLIGVLFNIEKNGLFVDYNKFVEKFGQNDIQNNLTFSEYNIYTTTGRPSNHHLGINYAALNKEDGTRSVFTSRFENKGFLIQCDYDAYHLRLIAELIGYDFPKKISVHEYLGKQYFQKDELTPEEYAVSKQVSFQQLYGGVLPEYQNIKYFQEVKKYIDKLFGEFKKNTYINTKVFNRELHKEFFTDINRNKIFNYLLQNFETERNMTVLYELIKYFNKVKAKSKLILYCYDSILFDYCIEDGKQLIIETKKILEQDGKYPIKIEIGSNYHNMKTTKRLSV